MELAAVKGDSVILLYHPSEGVAEVGQPFRILEMPRADSGLVVQIVANELIEFDGLAQGMIQRLLEERYTSTSILLNREDAAGGMDAVRDIKVARGKIRKRIVGNEWHSWDGYVPTRNVRIEKIDATDLLPRVLQTPAANVALTDIFSFQSVPCILNGPSMGHVCAAIGMKGRGKSHLTKLMILALAEKNIPTLAFDLNHEYEALPRAQVLRWKQNFRFSLSELGVGIVSTLVRAMNPLKEASEATFEHRITDFFDQRREACMKRGQRFTIDIPYLKSMFANASSMNEWVRSSIMDRLDQLEPLFVRWMVHRKTTKWLHSQC